jgi:hypothetical protein
VWKSFFSQKERRFDVGVENLIPNFLSALRDKKRKLRKWTE